jgi:hypothetical protein
MNASYVRLMLQDAAGNLRALLDEMESNPDFSEIELSIWLNDVFGSLNTAWNGRTLSNEQAAEMSEESYYRLRSFPVSDIIMDGK